MKSERKSTEKLFAPRSFSSTESSALYSDCDASDVMLD
jgi:hypothetical protein